MRDPKRSSGAKLGVYLTYREFFREEASRERFLSELSKFKCSAIFNFCQTATTQLKLWHGSRPAHPWEMDISAWLFPNILGEQICFDLKQAESRGGRVFFHTRQILYILKAAFQHCSENGVEVEDERLTFGLMLLMANDQFHIVERAPISALNEEDQTYSLLSEYIAINEYRGFDVVERIVRSWRMVVEIPPLLMKDPNFVELDKVFYELNRIQLLDFFAMCFALLVGDCEEYYTKVGAVLTYLPEFWQQTTLPKSSIEEFWKIVSTDISHFLQEVSRKDGGRSDFTAFRKYPLIQHGESRVCFDLVFIVEKLLAGVYWSIFFSSKETQSKLPRFWGAVFEKYVNDILQDSCLVNGKFLPDPRYNENHNEQLCDGLILVGEDLVVLEYKASMLTIEAKYRNDWAVLKREMHGKFVETSDGQKKGVLQLAAAVKKLTSLDCKTLVKDIDLSQVKRIFPVLVTLDEIGDCLLISRALNFTFEKSFTASERPQITVERMACVGISTLERISRILDQRPLTNMLNERFADDPHHKSNLASYVNDEVILPNDQLRLAHFNPIAEMLFERLGLQS
jgi:hypothetical protein